jgi:hypothetical protein
MRLVPTSFPCGNEVALSLNLVNPSPSLFATAFVFETVWLNRFLG